MSIVKWLGDRHLLIASAGALLLPIVILAAEGQPPRQVNPFRQAHTVATPSVARADLIACDELTRAKPQRPGALSVAEFGRMMSGTWVRELTWYGNPVTSESGLYFDINPATGALNAMMYDESNLEEGPMFAKREALKKNADARAKTATLTFVNCRYHIVDRYYKISDGHEFAFGPRAKNLGVTSGQGLRPVFERLRSQNFFALQPDERKRAALKSSGEQPLNETTTPTVGGGFFEGTVTSSPVRWPGQQPVQGVFMKMNGTYEGSHVGITTPDGKVSFKGTESALFFREGDAFVASTRSRLLRGPQAAGELAAKIGGWTTDCAGFFNLPDPMIFERVVLSTGF